MQWTWETIQLYTVFDMLVEVATMFERPGGNTHGNGKCVR